MLLGSLHSPWKDFINITEGGLSCSVTNIQNRLVELPMGMSFHLHCENSLDDYSVETYVILDG